MSKQIVGIIPLPTIHISMGVEEKREMVAKSTDFKLKQTVLYDANCYHLGIKQPPVMARVLKISFLKVQIEFFSHDHKKVIARWVMPKSIQLVAHAPWDQLSESEKSALERFILQQDVSTQDCLMLQALGFAELQGHWFVTEAGWECYAKGTGLEAKHPNASSGDEWIGIAYMGYGEQPPGYPTWIGGPHDGQPVKSETPDIEVDPLPTCFHMNTIFDLETQRMTCAGCGQVFIPLPPTIADILNSSDEGGK